MATDTERRREIVVGLFALTYLAHSDPINWKGFDKRELFQSPPAAPPAH